ncbi:MAG: GNAT family N-acetyltransferase [Actinomycetota bacterium]|nr:GNAT family N-acetyltransferase [Actinomycetota bacterium]
MARASTDQLVGLLEDAARRAASGSELEVLGSPDGPAPAAVLGFTGRCVVASAAPESWVRATLRGEQPFAGLKPRFIVALEEKLGLRNDGIDVVTVAEGLHGPASLRPVAASRHPRVMRAVDYRVDVQAYEAAGGAVVIIGRGLARRMEVAVEVAESERGRGHGRRGLLEARRLIGPGNLLFAQCAPGNAASLRALLSAGFRPIGSEVLFHPQAEA